MRRAQAGIAGLVAAHLCLRAGGARLAGGRLPGGLLRRVGRAADQLPLDQGRVAVQVTLGPGQFGLGRGQLRLRGLGLQRLVGRIQFSQQLALLHPRPGIDQPAHQLAADPERQRALLARMHVAGKAQRGVALPRLGLHHPDRTACLRRLLPAATTGQLRPRQQQGQCPGPHQPVHPVHPVFNIELAGMV